jgi:hypothetical protein
MDVEQSVNKWIWKKGEKGDGKLKEASGSEHKFPPATVPRVNDAGNGKQTTKVLVESQIY